MVHQLLAQMENGYMKIIKENLVGIYLHGSYAFGTYCHSVSDLDVLIVVYEKLTIDEKKQLLDYTINILDKWAPKKGIEFHVLQLKDTINLSYPIPFDLHFSPIHRSRYLTNKNKYIEDMMGYDEDLVAHLMITKLYGKVLVGKPIDSVFGWIDQKKYFESIVADVKEAKKEIVQQPMYVILNLCRVMAFKQENKILSKRAGGEWGLVHFPTNYHSLIQLALKEYQGETVLLEQYNDSELNDFADIMLSLLFK